MRSGFRCKVAAASLVVGLLGASCFGITSVSPDPKAIRLCDAARAVALIGRPFSEELADEAVRESSATGYRLLGPGIPSSADYLPDRLGIQLDAQRHILGFTCG